MPEGDTIATYAQRLRPLIVGQVLRLAESRWPAVAHGLVGLTVTDVRAIGKNLLLDLSDGSALRVHLGMHGTWHRYAPGERWRGSRGSLAIRLDTDEHVLVCFAAPTVERLVRGQEAHHEPLTKLGPDLMDPAADLDVVVANAVSRGGPIGEVLLDQRVGAGLGNVFKCELCFVFGLDPFGEVRDPEVLRAVYTKGGEWLRANVGRWRNTTGFGSDRPPFWVYGRYGRPCLRCGARVERRTTGRDLPRITFWCPRCQPAAAV